MATAYDRRDPVTEIVQAMAYGSGGASGTFVATGSYMTPRWVRIPLVLTSTANGTTNFVNPEPGTVMAAAFLIITVAGTGTFDMGRSSDGTGNSADLIDGGTLTVGVHYPGTVLGTADASSTVGGLNRPYFLLGGGGSGTNNSINVTHSDTTTSTMAGALVVEFYPITA